MTPLLIPDAPFPPWAAEILTGETLVLDGVPNAAYHGTKALISKSSLDLFARSPAHFHYAVRNPMPPEDDIFDRPEALVIGSAFHSYVLEPEVFGKEFVVLPDLGSMRSARNRDFRDRWLQDKHPDKQPLTQRQFRMISAMREGLYRNDRIRRVLENGQPEVTCACICKDTGLPLKCRWDWLSEMEGVALDLKTAADGSPSIWRLEAAKRRYHVQDSYYTYIGQQCGVDIDGMAFAVIEKEEPFVAGFYTMDATARLAGEMLYQRELQGIAERIASGRWEGYGDDAQELTLPSHATEIVKFGI